MTIEVIFPVSRTAAAAPVRTHVWGALPKAPVVGLIDNTKSRASDLLNAIGRSLVGRGAASSYFVWSKADAAHSITTEQRAELLARAHVIVSGVGD